MLNRDVILTEYRADARNFQRGAKIYDQTLAKQHRLTHDRLGRIDARWERSTRSILATRTALAGLTGLVGGAAITQLRSYAEEWRDVERRLQSIGVTGEAAQQSLVDLAIRTRSSVGGTAAAVQRLAKSTGGDIEVTTRRVETLQKLLASGGASGSERASVSLQLGQALQSGVLSGDEFRTALRAVMRTRPTTRKLRPQRQMMTDLGVKPEIEAFDTGHLWFAKQLVAEGILQPDALVQLCMGVPWGAPDDLNTFMAMVNNVPPEWTFSAFGLGRSQMPFVAASVLAGGNVRVGLEDNLMLDKGVLATNAQLVERAHGIIENLGARVIGPAEVREKLGLIKQAPVD